jgi:hypothetical protein
MRKPIIALLLASASAPLGATTYFATVNGTVTSQFDTPFTAAGATSPIKVGDTITATFSYNTGSTVGEQLARAYGMMGGYQASFSVGGYTWTSDGDFLDGFALSQLDWSEDPLAGYFSMMDDAPGGGDLWVQGYKFRIGEFGYDLYEGLGFSGEFDHNTLQLFADGVLTSGAERAVTDLHALTESAISVHTAVPEPSTWAMMIAGFALVGGAVRRRAPLTRSPA